MDLLVDFPGGDRVDAHFGPFMVHTDQPSSDGRPGSAPTPYELFLSSLATCAGIYVLGYCNKHDLPTQGIKLIEHVESDPATGKTTKIGIEIQVPAGFPEQYYPALVRSAEKCKVKQLIENPPTFEVYTKVVN
jgi:ribosomal protein S12 methylthiotransferase accessory factor